MKIHRSIQFFAALAIILHGTGAVRSFHNLTHHMHGVDTGFSTAAGEHLDDGFDGHSETGHSETDHSDPSDPLPSDSDGDDCELCLALGSVVLSHLPVLQLPLFATSVEQRVRPQAAVCVLYSSFDHPARAPPVS